MWKMKQEGSRSKVLNFSIDMRLIPSDIFEKTPHQIEDVIHNLKEFLKNFTITPLKIFCDKLNAVEDILR